MRDTRDATEAAVAMRSLIANERVAGPSLRPGVSLVQAAQEATLVDDAARDHGSGQNPRLNGGLEARSITAKQGLRR